MCVWVKERKRDLTLPNFSFFLNIAKNYTGRLFTFSKNNVNHNMHSGYEYWQ